MDFAKLIEKEIQKKRELVGKRKVGTIQDETTSNELKRKHIDKKIPKDETVEISKEDQRLINSISDEELMKKLQSINEPLSLENETKLEAIQRYTTKLKRKQKEIRYTTQRNKEATTDYTIIKQEIIDNPAKVYVQIRKYIKHLLQLWQITIEQQEQEQEQEQEQQLLHETKTDVVELLAKLRYTSLPKQLYTSLAMTIVCLQDKDYNGANTSYMEMSIGNVAWPIGVVSVGIHLRSGDSKISGTNERANVMIDDATRRWIVGVKRLIGWCERNL